MRLIGVHVPKCFYTSVILVTGDRAGGLEMQLKEVLVAEIERKKGSQ